jgi:hypothetical protein
MDLRPVAAMEKQSKITHCWTLSDRAGIIMLMAFLSRRYWPSQASNEICTVYELLTTP